MNTNGCVAMVLAGGRGERLGALTQFFSKPAVHFGTRRRIIDFTLNNCHNSGLDTIGILSQYYSNDLHAYINGSRNAKDSGIIMLPPKRSDESYIGTADAIYKNIEFIERYTPDCVLVLAGDHIYDMDYRDMIQFHRDNSADVTIASTRVTLQEASRFGIIGAQVNGRVQCFEEKPAHPSSDLASMGIYVFSWDKLKEYLIADSKKQQSKHDFGRNILPEMLQAGESMFAYQYSGYWRDVGTVDCLWEANMDQIDELSATPVKDGNQSVFSSDYTARNTVIRKSIFTDQSLIFGNIEHSILGDAVVVCSGAEVVDSVIMPGAYIGENAKIYKTVVGPNAIVGDHTMIGMNSGSDFFRNSSVCARDVSLVAPWLHIQEGMRFQGGSHIFKEKLQEWINLLRATEMSVNQIAHHAQQERDIHAVRQPVSL